MSAFHDAGRTFRDPTQVARLVTAGLVLAAVFQVGVTIVIGRWLVAGTTVSISMSERGALGPGGWRVFQLVAAMISTSQQVVLLIWQYRVHTNARLAAPHLVPTSPGWGVLCWFVPFVNFVKPYLVLREIRVASVPQTNNGGWTLRLLWGAFLGSLAMLWIGLFDVMFDAFEAMRSLVPLRVLIFELDGTALRSFAVAELLALAAVLCWVRFVREVTRSQVAIGPTTTPVIGKVPARPDVS